ncbi:hypothetical protein FRC08_013533, partial [Ceratobasidium sp. 394]
MRGGEFEDRQAAWNVQEIIVILVNGFEIVVSPLAYLCNTLRRVWVVLDKRTTISTYISPPEIPRLLISINQRDFLIVAGIAAALA